MKIDINFNFYSDTPKGKDPDSHSPTLRNYHKILWSKALPNGLKFELDDKTPMRLHHKSNLNLNSCLNLIRSYPTSLADAVALQNRSSQQRATNSQLPTTNN